MDGRVAPFAVCISSSKLAEGAPISTPFERNGNGPLKWLWNSDDC